MLATFSNHLSVHCVFPPSPAPAPTVTLCVDIAFGLCWELPWHQSCLCPDLALGLVEVSCAEVDWCLFLPCPHSWTRSLVFLIKTLVFMLRVDSRRMVHFGIRIIIFSFLWLFMQIDYRLPGWLACLWGPESQQPEAWGAKYIVCAQSRTDFFFLFYFFCSLLCF